ncbi:MAG: hypothetical protein Tsb0015_01840 [Simkaniaceae bacterium]
MRNKFQAFVQTLSFYEKLFLVLAMLTGACITADYAIVKPTSNSIFISSYGIKAFPYAWLLALPVNFIFVSLYNKFLPKIGCLRMMWLSVLSIIGLNIYAAMFISQISWLPFLLYIWKDIYVLFMFQQLWSVIHATVSKERAKFFYGIMFGVGGLGAVLGSCIPGFFAVKVGSSHLLFMTLPIYLFFAVVYSLALKARSKITHLDDLKILKEGEAKASQGFKLIKNSKNLQFILLIVICMQVTSTILEFQFNTYLSQKIPHLDQRTEFYGRLFAVINAVNLFLQFIGSFLLVSFIGLRRSHFLIPSILGLNMLFFFIYPIFQVITYCFSVIKSFDYSIFTIIKEMLYSPLKIHEKFHAKALIDVFAYRTSKALASFLVLFMQSISISFVPLLTIGNIMIFGLWIFASVYLYREGEEAETA